MKWTPVEEAMPEPNKPVIAFYRNIVNKPRVIRAMYAAKGTLPCYEECCEGGEYDEQEDCYWAPEGWYEENDHEEVHWWVDGKVTHWMPMPEPTEEMLG